MGKEMIEYRDSQNLAYILTSQEFFSPIGYKVLQSQMKQGFVRCTRVIHNGKDKLVYDISGFRPLDSYISTLSPDKFLLLFSNLLDVVLEVRGNGFMQCDNIDLSADKIFVDANNLKVFLVYLPVEEKVSLFGNEAFEEVLAHVMVEVMNQMREPPLGLKSELDKETKTLEQLVDAIKAAQVEANIHKAEAAEKSQNLQEEIVETKGKKSLFSDIFTKRVKEEKRKVSDISATASPKPTKEKAIVRKKQPEAVMQTMVQGGATELLDDFFVPSLLLVGMKTPEKTEIAISKQEFTIGKKADAVDYAITFSNAVSRTHCKVIFEKGGSFVLDLGSVNGTYVNGARLTANTKTPIKVGDKLKIANLEFQVNVI